MIVSIRDQETLNPIVALDASLAETHAGDVEVTDHPVEQGANISDHLRPKPRTLSVHGFISNTPVIDGAKVTAPFLPDQPGPAQEAYAALRDARLSGRLVQVVTSLETYENMAITGISVPRDHATSQALEFTINFKEVRVVFNQTLTVQTAAPQHQPVKKLATRAAATTTPTADNRTVAAKLDDLRK